MKYAGKTFTLYPNEPVAIQGSDSLYTYQNTGTGTATILGSNNAVNWTTVATVASEASHTGSHAYAFLMMTGSTEVSVSRGVAGDTRFSSTNPLPVAQTDGLSVSGTVIGTAANQATSGIATVLFTTSMLNYESITVQVTSAGTYCTITYEASEDGVTWQSTSGVLTSNVGSTSFATASAIAAIFQFPRKALFFRARVITYGSGTVSVVGSLSKVSVQYPAVTYILGTASENGNVISNIIPVGLEGRTSSKTSVSNAYSVRPISTLDGRQIVRLDAIPENEWSYVAASGGITNTTTAVDLAGGAGSGVRNYVTSLQLYSDTLGTATEIILRDGAGGSILWRSKIGTAGTVGIQNIRFHPPLRGSTNTLLQAACVTATDTGSIYLNVQGYKAP